MPSVNVYNMSHDVVGEISLPDSVFASTVRRHLLHAVVRYQLAGRRQGTHKAKERAEVRGGGKKPWRQKGTGRARQGSTRSPQWRGGGVVFGPRVRSHAFKLNKKVRRLALCSALSARLEANDITIVDELVFSAPRTKDFVRFMQTFELSDALLVADVDDSLVKSSRNVQGVSVVAPGGVNVYDILRRRSLVMTKAAVAAVVARLEGGDAA